MTEIDLNLVPPSGQILYKAFLKLGDGVTIKSLYHRVGDKLSQATKYAAMKALEDSSLIKRVDGCVYFPNSEPLPPEEIEKRNLNLPASLSTNNRVLLSLASRPEGVIITELAKALPNAKNRTEVQNVISKARISEWITNHNGEMRGGYKIYNLAKLGQSIFDHRDSIPEKRGYSVGKQRDKTNKTPPPPTRKRRIDEPEAAPVVNVDRFANALVDNVAQVMNANAEYRQALIDFRNSLARQIETVDAFLDKYM